MRRILVLVALACSAAALATGALVTQEHWLPWLHSGRPAEPGATAPPAGHGESQSVKLSEQAFRSLGLISKPVRLETYWRSVTVPATVVDRPGLSDRGVTAAIAGVVRQIHAFPGETVRAGDRLVTLRLVSEYLQGAQADLFKTHREILLNREQRERMAKFTRIGVEAETKLVDLDNQHRRLTASARAYRHTLQAAGLQSAQIEKIEGGEFVTELVVTVPSRHPTHLELVRQEGKGPTATLATQATMPIYEVQDLKVELGQQVQAGQVLAYLSIHQLLAIEGRAFKSEAGLIEKAAEQAWPVEVDAGSGDRLWPASNQSFVIRSLGNVVDPGSRTIPFYLMLVNQSRSYVRDGKTFLVWRFRPGQRLRLQVPVERLDGVIVLPVEALARKGLEAYVFRQNGDLFDRKPVRVLFEDRRHVVLANDGSIAPGLFVAQNNAAALQRALEAQNASGQGGGGHWHADGTYHAH